MGRDLKGKQLGKGLTQEKSVYYVARFVDKFGKRQSKRFDKLQEAKQWLADSIYLDKNSNISMPRDMTVDAFADFWFDTKQKMSRETTADVYRKRYQKSIKPYIGDMKIIDVKANHCQMIINHMIDDNYSHDTIGIARSILNGLFDYAVECDVIMKTPCKLHLKSTVGKSEKQRDALTIDAQKRLLQAVKGHEHENQFRFVMQTGLRVGELCALKWENVDFDNKIIEVRSSMKYLYDKGTWYIGVPKSRAGRRTIPLTDEAIQILKCQKAKNNSLKVIPLEWRDYVFLNKNGMPIPHETYYSALKKLCKKENIMPISMHNLRHTFATRCIEAGMRPKILQTIMGHSSISVTMDLYVHTTDDELFSAIDMVSNALKVI